MQKLFGGKPRLSQNVLGGLALLALSALGLWLTRDLSQGTLSSMGAGLMPRWLGLLIGLCGIVLLVMGLRAQSEAIEPANWRGIALIVVAIVGFGIFIRPFALGPISTPTLGLIITGPFAVIVGGLAAPDARLRELVVLALVLTGSCMFLFGDILNLPIPIFPQFVVPYLAGISAKLALRVAAAVLLVVGIFIGMSDILKLRRAAKLGAAELEKKND